MKFRIAATILAAGMVSMANAAPQTKPLARRRAIQTAPLTKASPTAPKLTAWQPTPFVVTTANLPANYTGMDSWETYRFMSSLADKTKKDEFETTTQYESRMANPSNIMGALDPRTLYAFQISPRVSYNADAQAYIVGSDYGSACNQKDYSSKDGIRFCEIKTHFDDAPDYQGENAYGAKATIKRIRGTTISLAIDASKLPKSVFKKEEYLDNYKVSYRIPMAIEQASALRGKKIAILAIGYITGPELIEGPGVYSKPTISDPTDMAVSSYGIPFNVQEFIFYVVETGQVLERVSAS